MWNMKCAGKQILVVEMRRAAMVLLAHCSGESAWLALLTLTSLLCHCLLREHIRAERKGSQGLAHLFNPQWKMLCGPQPKSVQTASMSSQQVRCWAMHKLLSRWRLNFLCQKCLELRLEINVYTELIIRQTWLSSKTKDDQLGYISVTRISCSTWLLNSNLWG